VISDAPGAAPAVSERLERRLGAQVVLVTGFPAARARAVVELLLEREPDISLWLVVPPAELERAARALAELPSGGERARLIPGEPCAIDLGVSRQVYAELSREVRRWFALYQTVDTRAPRELCFRVNVGSAREIVELSRVSQGLEHVTFFSSALVFGDRSGPIDEEALSVGQAFRSAAAESLALGEAILRRNLDRAPVSVLRTPAVLGSRGGQALPQPSGLHRLLALLAAAPADAALPLPPGSSHRLVHALPADFAAEALYAISVLGARGRAYHVAAHAAPALAEVLSKAAPFFERRLESGFDPRALGRLLLQSPGFWLTQQGSGVLSEWAEAPELSTRGGDELLAQAGLRAPALLEYVDSVLRETRELLRERRMEGEKATAPFEVVT
jgi:Male sterility protein